MYLKAEMRGDLASALVYPSTVVAEKLSSVAACGGAIRK